MKKTLFAIAITALISSQTFAAPSTGGTARYEYQEFNKPDGSTVVLKRDLSKAHAQAKPDVSCQRYIGPYPTYGTAISGEFWVAYGPYTTTCRGTHQAGFTAANLPLLIQFQRLDEDTGRWRTVDISYMGYINEYGQPSGTYRILVAGQGGVSNDNPQAWTLNVTTPTN
ncbi:hypothetical protein ABGV49_08045 [Chromobacterium vaccinii]|uniref:Uncharacterized protein n=1 Tax=Chromobacterium vaccinii TaxID=1108595 RepID=A0ABV0FAA0_9NEIS